MNVNGSPLQVHGSAPVQLQLGGISYPTDVVVVSPLTTEAILGLDFLQKNEVTIDAGRCTMQMGKQGSIKMYQNSLACADGVGLVSLVDSLTLEPRSECVVLASCEGLPGQGPCIVEPELGRRIPFVVARALVEPKDGKVPVRLLNPSLERVSLKPQSVGANIERVDSPSERIVGSVSSEDSSVSNKAETLWGIVEQTSSELKPDEKEQFFPACDGKCRYIRHIQVRFGPNKYTRQAVRRLPPPKRKEVQELLAGMLKNGVVQLSSSPWASPIVLV